MIELVALLLLTMSSAAVTLPVDTAMYAGSFYEETASLNPERLLAVADSAYKARDNSLAMSLYLSICGRDSEDFCPEIKIKAYIGAGDVMMRKCYYPGALEYYVEGLMLCETDTAMWRRYSGEFYKNIGNVYSSLNDYEQGIHYYKLALEESDPKQNGLRVRTLYNLAGFSTYVGNAKEARQYLAQARKCNYQWNDVTRFLDVFIEGLVLGCEGHSREAIANLRKSEKYAIDHGMSARYLCSARQHLYVLYGETGRTDSMYYYLKGCEESAERNGIRQMFPGLLSDIADYHYSHGDSVAGKEYRYRYLDLRDSIGNEREFDAVKQVRFQYESRKVAGKIESLRLEKDKSEALIVRQRVWLLAVGGGLIIVGAFLWIIAWQNRNLKRSYLSLYNINRDSARREEEQKYGSSNLKEERIGELAKDIEELMDGEKIYCEPEFSLDMLSDRVGVNSKYVSQTINMAFGKNFSNYVNDYRVRLACERLEDDAYSHYTVAAVGESVGFKSQSSFTSVFRKITGLSPSMFRKMSIFDKNREQCSKNISDS